MAKAKCDGAAAEAEAVTGSLVAAMIDHRPLLLGDEVNDAKTAAAHGSAIDERLVRSRYVARAVAVELARLDLQHAGVGGSQR